MLQRHGPISVPYPYSPRIPLPYLKQQPYNHCLSPPDSQVCIARPTNNSYFILFLSPVLSEIAITLAMLLGSGDSCPGLPTREQVFIFTYTVVSVIGIFSQIYFHPKEI